MSLRLCSIWQELSLPPLPAHGQRSPFLRAEGCVPAGFPGTGCCLERSFFSRKVSQIRVRGCEGWGSEGWAPGAPRLLLPTPHPGPWDRVCQAGGCFMRSQQPVHTFEQGLPGPGPPLPRQTRLGPAQWALRRPELIRPTPGLWASCHPAPGGPLSQDPLRARAKSLPAPPCSRDTGGGGRGALGGPAGRMARPPVQDKGLPEAELREGGSSRRKSSLAPSPRDGERGAAPGLRPHRPQCLGLCIAAQESWFCGWRGHSSGPGRGRAGSVGFCEGCPIHVLSSWARCPVPSGRETLCLTRIHLTRKYRATSCARCWGCSKSPAPGS